MNRAGRQELRALREKYERMRALRDAHARARADASFVEPDPRPEMGRLAEQFPGALREIDTLTLEIIAARITSIAVAERDPSRAEPWMTAQIVFHRYARGALAAKRWLAGRKAITPALRAAFARAAPGGDAAELYADDLERIASPPGGRLMDLVHAKVARALRLTEAEARLLVFGPRRRRAPEP